MLCSIAVLFTCVVANLNSYVEASIADQWYQATRCTKRSVSKRCFHYERCKATQRCPRAEEVYHIRNATLQYFDRTTKESHAGIPLMNDFEDWKTGTHGWRLYDVQEELPYNPFGFTTRDFKVIGSLELSGGFLLFDTDHASVRGDINLDGVITHTSLGSKVAVFNFMTVFLDKHVQVRFVGQAAIAILSRSSMIINTNLHVRAGTLGGFPGGGYIGTDYTANNYNLNGPGSSNVRVYVKTLSIAAIAQPEVQQVQIYCADGQNLGGYFQLKYKGSITQPIAYDASSEDLRLFLDDAFQALGFFHVTRLDTSEQVPSIGRTWRITFLNAIGDVDLLQSTSKLTGWNASIIISTIQDGEFMTGHFSLSFNGKVTRRIDHDVTASDLEKILVHDLELLHARVMRSNSFTRCSTFKDTSASSTATSPTYDPSEWLLPEYPNERSTFYEFSTDKNYICVHNQDIITGLVWKLRLYTSDNNLSPTSPSLFPQTIGEPCISLIANGTELIGSEVNIGTIDSQCFSIAFGGGGASHGGIGGPGYVIKMHNIQQPRALKIEDLVGGSGGAAGGDDPLLIYQSVQPVLGGNGGGVLYLAALNDIWIGPAGVLSTDGDPGDAGFRAGGGGSGGTIFLQSNATISIQGSLTSNGGAGGGWRSSMHNAEKEFISASSGGGGGGGRIAIYSASFNKFPSATIEAKGGEARMQSRRGSSGTVYIPRDLDAYYRIDPTLGAAGTFKSLLLQQEQQQILEAVPGFLQRSSRTALHMQLPKLSHAERALYYVRVGNLAQDIQGIRGAIFGLQSDSDSNEMMLAVAIVNGKFTHGRNAHTWPRTQFYGNVQPNRWYKLDIRIRWSAKTYSIFLNDILRVKNAPFDAEYIAAVSIWSDDAMSTWWDEIYLGLDHSLDFECPLPNEIPDSEALHTENAIASRVQKRHLRQLWRAEPEKANVIYHSMTRFASHLSEREEFSGSHTNIAPYDGEPHVAYTNDAVSSDEDLESEFEPLQRSELLTFQGNEQDPTIVYPLSMEDSKDTKSSLGNDDLLIESDLEQRTTYWYSEILHHDNKGRILAGGIGACSTKNFIDWQNEGTVLFFENLTDPFGSKFNGSLLAAQPKVLFNRQNKTFVMWMHVATIDNEFGFSGVAVSRYPNGPFDFLQSFQIDAPMESPATKRIYKVQDFTIGVMPSADSSTSAAAFLIRSYRKTTEYWLPRPVMDPQWQSLKNLDRETDFGLSYHRAYYHEKYDDPHDIYLQRWRMEDVGWSIRCCKFVNETDCVVMTLAEADSGDAMRCPDDRKHKAETLGQAQISDPIQSRYKDPMNPIHSAFSSYSTSSHTSWGSQVYNIKTWRGNYFDALSTNITAYVFHRYAEQQSTDLQLTNDSDAYDYRKVIDRINTSHSNVIQSLIGDLGLMIPLSVKAKYSAADLMLVDRDDDGKIILSEAKVFIASRSSVGSELYKQLLGDYNLLKISQANALDGDHNGEVTLEEFEAWLGRDPNLVFDQFDLDKSGYWDENELSRFLRDRQIPRLDHIILSLDPSIDGRVYYQSYLSFLKIGPSRLFDSYDIDSSQHLSSFELNLLIQDLGSQHTSTSGLYDLIDSQNQISKDNYLNWIGHSTSRIGSARYQLTVDNAIHATGPDRLVGPMHVVETRSAPYVGIYRLESDYMSTKGLLQEIEGAFEDSNSLINFFAFEQNLYGLSDETYLSNKDIFTFRQSLSEMELHDHASYWNGRDWEPRRSAPDELLYGQICENVAGVQGNGCLPCPANQFQPAAVYDTMNGSACDSPSKIMNAYIKEFDQQISLPLQFQQTSTIGPQGLQPHYSPCLNQSQDFPCDIHKIYDGNVADPSPYHSRHTTQWNVVWERHEENAGSSKKLRASSNQYLSHGTSFTERFPQRDRAPSESMQIDAEIVYQPSESHSVTGGGT